MKSVISTGAAALALLLAGCGDGAGDLNTAANQAGSAPLTQIPAPNNGDWTETVTQTPEGGYLLGNPDAPVKLIEYASLTCPHCRTFSEEGGPTLRDTYVRSGQVSWEFRNFLLGGPDAALSVLARCQPPAAFFSTVEQIFSQQSEFIAAIDDNEARQIQALPPERQLAPLARAMDADRFFARRGMPESRFNQCIGNPQAVQQLSEMTDRAMREEQVTGTPTFFINGQKQDVNAWSAIEPLLRAAIGG